MSGGVVCIVALDENHDPDIGHPVTPDDAPARRGERVWGVYEQVDDESEDGFHWAQIEGSLTADEAEEIT
jgi:hypothetical protein